MCSIGNRSNGNNRRNKVFKSHWRFWYGKLLLVFCLALLILPILQNVADASPTGRGLPWETTLKALSDSFKGPVAYAICILMIVAGCFGIMFGGDLAGWIRWACMAAVVVGMIGLSAEVLDMMGMSTAPLR